MEKIFTKQVLQDNERNTGGPCTRTQCSVSTGVVTMLSQPTLSDLCQLDLSKLYRESNCNLRNGFDACKTSIFRDFSSQLLQPSANLIEERSERLRRGAQTRLPKISEKFLGLVWFCTPSVVLTVLGGLSSVNHFSMLLALLPIQDLECIRCILDSTLQKSSVEVEAEADDTVRASISDLKLLYKM